MDKENDFLKLENQLCFPIYLCSKEIIRKYNILLKELDLTYTQYIVMMYFWEVKKCNVKELGKVLLLDSSTLTPLLKKLATKGFITRTRSRIDERNLELRITSKGEELKDKAKMIPMKMGECISLNEKEVKSLYELINKVLLNVERNDK